MEYRVRRPSFAGFLNQSFKDFKHRWSFCLEEEASEDQSQSAAEKSVHHVLGARGETRERTGRGQLAQARSQQALESSPTE